MRTNDFGRQAPATIGEYVDLAFSDFSFMRGIGQGASPYDALDDAMQLRNWFDNAKLHKQMPQPFSCEDLLMERLQDKESFLADIADGLRSTQQGKPDAVRRMVLFLSYLNHSYHARLDLSIFTFFSWDSEAERRLTMLRYVHDKQHSRQEIADALGISLRTANQDIACLKDGFRFLGTDIQITQAEGGDFGSSVNPIFLALNTADIFLLTVGLSMLAEETVFSSRAYSLVGQIMHQLSPVSKETMLRQSQQYHVQLNDEPPQFENTNTLMKREHEAKAPFTYFLREPIPCEVTYTPRDVNGNPLPPRSFTSRDAGDASVTRTATGIMTIADRTPGGFRHVAVTSGKKRIVIPMEDVIRIVRVDGESIQK